MTKEEIMAILREHQRINCFEFQSPRQYFDGIVQSVFETVAEVLETKQ